MPLLAPVNLIIVVLDQTKTRKQTFFTVLKHFTKQICRYRVFACNAKSQCISCLHKRQLQRRCTKTDWHVCSCPLTLDDSWRAQRYTDVSLKETSPLSITMNETLLIYQLLSHRDETRQTCLQLRNVVKATTFFFNTT